MIPHPAQYLLRIDDLCPTHDRERWQRFKPLLEEFGIKPILAIVPENADPALNVSEPDPRFWLEMRALQGAGAAIGMHGYRHLCGNRGRSLVPLHRDSEFAGVVEPIQRQWIRNGLDSLREHGLDPTVWVAPRHGFDLATLRVLREFGVTIVSDGFALRPFTHHGLTWLPQQLWAPATRTSGLWTICMHPNTATDAQVQRFRDFLRARADQFTTVDRVIAEYCPKPLTTAEQFTGYSSVLLRRTRSALSRMLLSA